MKGDRVRCPYCGEDVIGVERIPGLVAFGYNRATATINSGTMPCRCGAILVISAGTVVEFAPPEVKPKEVKLLSVIERLFAMIPGKDM